MKKLIIAAFVAATFTGVAHAHGHNHDGEEIDKGVVYGSAFMGTNDSTDLTVGYVTKSDIAKDSMAFVEVNQFSVSDKVTGNGMDYGVNLLNSKGISAGLMKKDGDFGYGVALSYSDTEIESLNYKRNGLGIEGHIGYDIGQACIYGNVAVKPDFLSNTTVDNLYAEVDLKAGIKYNLNKKVAVFSEVKSGTAYDSNDKRTDLYSTVGAGVSVAF
jgi:hypothetical protein